MGKISPGLRFTFIAFNGLFLIAGCVLLILILIVTFSMPSEEGVVAMLQFWFLCFGIIGLSSLGIYGGVSEKKIPLIVFAVLMGISTLITFGRGLQAAVLISQVRFHMRKHSRVDDVLNTPFQIILGLFFGTGCVALVGTIMSVFMVYQIRRHDDNPETFVPLRSTCGDGRHA